MGEGKTRVIVHMLALHWTEDPRRRVIVRIHFLSQLLEEAFEFLHEALTASVLQKKLFRMPFHRDVGVISKPRGVEVMINRLELWRLFEQQSVARFARSLAAH